MSTVTKFFFRVPATEPTVWSVVHWWESRRFAYNLAVGAAGLVSLAAITVASIFPPLPGPVLVPWQPILLYAIAANVCYTAGSIVDFFVCRRWGAEYDAVGPALFRYGFAFSVGLTLIPVPIAIASSGLRILSDVIN